MMQTICFRLPNWLGDVCMALPVIKAIQAKYPDAEFTFLSQAPYIDMLDKLSIKGEKIALPKKNWAYFFQFLKQRRKFDKHILFTNSERGDMEAWLMGSRERYGIARPNKPRKLLTQRYTLTPDFDEEKHHQTFLWRDFTAEFGLHDGIDLSPVKAPDVGCVLRTKLNSGSQLVRGAHPTSNAIGLICGSANTPEKRWAVENWQTLLKELLARDVKRIVLIGTKDDIAVCSTIAEAVDDSRVENWAGKTDLTELTDLMQDLSLVIGNDTGGLHIANALGVPVIGLYGYTNPMRCHPIIDAPLAILQSPKGYGEGVMEDITVTMVLTAITQ